MTLDEIKRYVLILREEEMDNNYKLSDEQIALVKKVEREMIENKNTKEKIDKILVSKSNNEINHIQQGKEYINEPIVANVENMNGGRQLVYKKAGFVDALVMALVTGFVGGMATTILFMLIK